MGVFNLKFIFIILLIVNLSLKEINMPLDPSKRVIIRVWTSEENKQFPGHNVGHVSLETPERYMSLWPVPFTQNQINEYRAAGDLERMYKKYFMERKPDFKSSYQEDYAAEENQPPQVVICLYGLDIHSIENEFDRLLKITEGWRLIGSNQFVQKLESAAEVITAHSKIFESEVGNRRVDSCASLALKLLKIGGISQYIDLSKYSTFTSKTSSVVKPDDILEVIIPAKINELKQIANLPNKHAFQYTGNPLQNDPPETDVNQFDNSLFKNCVLL